MADCSAASQSSIAVRQAAQGSVLVALLANIQADADPCTRPAASREADLQAERGLDSGSVPALANAPEWVRPA
jgi:hypothetical protein